MSIPESLTREDAHVAERDPAEAPLVSVIIPAYNVECYVAAAIDSALAQTYPNVEVVVVDDGSTDRTAEVVAGYGDRVVTVTQENRGLAGARNAGIRAAAGSVLALLDADDLWLPERLERCVPLLTARPEIGMVTSDAYVIEETVKTTKRCYGDRRRYPFPAHEDEQLDIIAKRNFLFISVVFRRSLVDRCGGFDESMRRAEDYELWTRFLLSGSRAAFVPEPLGYYRVRADSLSASKEQWGAHLSVLERHLPELWRRGAHARARDAYEIGERLVARGERRAAITFFRHAVTGDDIDYATRARFAASALRTLALPG
jgi:glycosyltransferase involved in cell wall biosynthesis